MGMLDGVVGDIGGGIMGAGASLVGNIMQSNQQKAAAQQQFQNNMMLQMQQQAYNTEMSNTQYQRTTADMKLAGLNPILAAGGFSPDSASSSAASVSPRATTNLGEGLVSSAEQGAKLSKVLQGLEKELTKKDEEIKNLGAQRAYTSAQTSLAGVEALARLRDVPIKEAQAAREKQAAHREGLTGTGHLSNVGTWETIGENVVKAVKAAGESNMVSPKSHAVPHSAKEQGRRRGNGGDPEHNIITPTKGVYP